MTTSEAISRDELVALRDWIAALDRAAAEEFGRAPTQAVEQKHYWRHDALKQVLLRVDSMLGESGPPARIVSLPDDVEGGVPSLRPGDVVQVGCNIGVISKSQVVVDGSCCNWYNVKPMVDHGNMLSHAIEWGSANGLRNAWWNRSELKVVSLGPFHAGG